MGKRISIGRDGKVKEVKHYMVGLDAQSRVRLLELAVKEKKSISAVVRNLVKDAVERGREK